MPASSPSSLAVAADEPPLPAGEERAGHLGEMVLDRGVGLLEEPLDRGGQVVAELRQLLERALEILALRRELLEALLLARVLLRRERVHLAERLAPALEALDLRPELVDLLVGESLRLAALGEARQHVFALPRQSGGFDARSQRASPPPPSRPAEARPRVRRAL